MTKLDSKFIEFEFGMAEFFDHYLVMVMNEGITVVPKYNDKLVDIARSIYTDRPFGYISYRKNSYSVDPSIYRETSKIENLIAFAIVSKEEIHFSTAQVESIFLKKPLSVFRELNEATSWVESLIHP